MSGLLIYKKIILDQINNFNSVIDYVKKNKTKKFDYNYTIEIKIDLTTLEDLFTNIE